MTNQTAVTRSMQFSPKIAADPKRQVAKILTFSSVGKLKKNDHKSEEYVFNYSKWDFTLPINMFNKQ